MAKIDNDQYFTKLDVAQSCWNAMIDLLGREFLDGKILVEPSVGAGAFVKSCPLDFPEWVLFDIDSSNYDLEGVVYHQDFLESEEVSRILPTVARTSRVAIGNPPFGRRAKLAVDFVNECAKYASTIGFILPIQFDKYLTQNKLEDSLRLVHSHHLEQDSFVTPEGKELEHLRTGFYIWTNDETVMPGVDERIREKPAVSHPDFNLWQYNNTKEAEKYFDRSSYPWEFAVLRQGYGDYEVRYINPETMPRNKQYIFIQPLTDRAREVFRQIDFSKLSHKNTTIPGFGKADLIAEYVMVEGRIG